MDGEGKKPVMTLLRLEYFKIRRKKIGLMLLLVLGAEMLWAAMSLSMSFTRNPDQAVWEAVIFSLSSMNGLFMPVVTAVVVSRICDMEQKGNTWKMLLATDVSPFRLYAAKYICSCSLLLAGILAQTGFILAFGWVKDLPGGAPLELLVPFICGALLTTAALAALQQWISIGIKNQAFALCAGMLGGFVGMTAGLFPAAIRRLAIWSYYLELSPVTYQFAEPSGTYVTQPVLSAAVLPLLAGLLFYAAGSILTTRKER